MLRTTLTLRRRASIVATTASLAASASASAFVATSARADNAVADSPSTSRSEAAATEPASLPAPPKKHRVGFAGRLYGGYGERRLYDHSIVGADLVAGAGIYTPSVDLYMDGALLIGSIEGLSLRQLRLGPAVELEAFSRVRLGAGISLGGTTISRATSGDAMTAFDIGARIFGSVDLWKAEDRWALYLLGQLSVDSAQPFFTIKFAWDGPPPTVATIWGPTVAAGVRF